MVDYRIYDWMIQRMGYFSDFETYRKILHERYNNWIDHCIWQGDGLFMEDITINDIHGIFEEDLGDTEDYLTTITNAIKCLKEDNDEYQRMG